LGKNVKTLFKAARESKLGFSYVNIYCRMVHDVCTVKFTIVTSRQENVITVFILTSFIQMNINVVIKYLYGCQFTEGVVWIPGENYAQRHILIDRRRGTTACPA